MEESLLHKLDRKMPWSVPTPRAASSILSALGLLLMTPAESAGAEQFPFPHPFGNNSAGESAARKKEHSVHGDLLATNQMTEQLLAAIKRVEDAATTPPHNVTAAALKELRTIHMFVELFTPLLRAQDLRKAADPMALKKRVDKAVRAAEEALSRSAAVLKRVKSEPA